MSEYFNLGIILQIIGFLLALSPTKQWIFWRVFEIIIIKNRKELIKAKENRPPKTLSEKMDKMEATWKKLKEILDRTADKTDEKKIMDSGISKLIGFIGVCMIIAGLVLQLQ